MKQLHTAQTLPDHPLTLLTGKRNTKSNESSHTDSSDDQNGFNISSNGKDTLKATTHGSQLTRSMPLNLSSITTPQQPISHPQQPISHPQQPISHPQPTINQQPEGHISQHHLSHI